MKTAAGPFCWNLHLPSRQPCDWKGEQGAIVPFEAPYFSTPLPYFLLSVTYPPLSKPKQLQTKKTSCLKTEPVPSRESVTYLMIVVH